MATYILSIDAGTTSSRAIIFDENLKKIGIGQNEFAQYFPKNRWIAHGPKEFGGDNTLRQKPKKN